MVPCTRRRLPTKKAMPPEVMRYCKADTGLFYADHKVAPDRRQLRLSLELLLFVLVSLKNRRRFRARKRRLKTLFM